MNDELPKRSSIDPITKDMTGKTIVVTTPQGKYNLLDDERFKEKPSPWQVRVFDGSAGEEQKESHHKELVNIWEATEDNRMFPRKLLDSLGIDLPEGRVERTQEEQLRDDRWNAYVNKPMEGMIHMGDPVRVDHPLPMSDFHTNHLMGRLRMELTKNTGLMPGMFAHVDQGDDGRVVVMPATRITGADTFLDRWNKQVATLKRVVNDAVADFARATIIAPIDLVGYGVGDRYNQRSSSMRQKKRRRVRALVPVYKEVKPTKAMDAWLVKNLQPSAPVPLTAFHGKRWWDQSFKNTIIPPPLPVSGLGEFKNNPDGSITVQVFTQPK